jgi:hypothetical protein
LAEADVGSDTPKPSQMIYQRVDRLSGPVHSDL